MSTSISEKEYWDSVFFKEDPWNYTSEYEQTKYNYTLEMLPEGEINSALELGCAEGHFTEKFAQRVNKLLAVDISERALARARDRCAGFDNITFLQHNIEDGIPYGSFDLIVCAEILYYLRNRFVLNSFAKKTIKALNIGGHLILTHANMVTDDRTHTGFDFNEIGAQFIGKIFSSKSGLEFLKELQTPLYRIQVFRRRQTPVKFAFFKRSSSRLPREVIQRDAHFQHPTIKWGGCVVSAAEAKHCWITRNVPILMYHRIADDGPVDLAPYRISPAMFERQLSYLQRHGYHSISLDNYYQFVFEEKKEFFLGKIVVFTFDDAYLDFYDTAWPMLKKYGFQATVFVPTDFVGGYAEWDNRFGKPAKLMDWNHLSDLSSQGVTFGAHSCSHRRRAKMTDDEALNEAIQSKAEIENQLKLKVKGYSHPFNEINQRVTEMAGYSYAVGGFINDSKPKSRYCIPRIEIFGYDNMDDFIKKIPPPEKSSFKKRAQYYGLKILRDRATYMER